MKCSNSSNAPQRCAAWSISSLKHIVRIVQECVRETEAGCEGVCAVLTLRRTSRLPTAGPSAAGGGVTDRQMEGGERLRRKPLCV